MAHVFLDLDGTLTDPKRGITGAISGAMAAIGLPSPPCDELEWAIGPALLETFAKLGAPDPEAALAEYRKIYTKDGLFDADVYPNIQNALDQIAAMGHQLYLMTAKPHIYAKRITAHFGLDTHLTEQFGPELDGTHNDKAELLAFALKKLGVQGPSVMIGDRIHDLKAAVANQMPFIGVDWGYGSRQELQGADMFCKAPADLPEMLKNLLD